MSYKVLFSKLAEKEVKNGDKTLYCLILYKK